MIISHKYKFIFIKTRKTAGTSIEVFLSKFCNPDDVLTPILEEDLHQPRNYSGFFNPVPEILKNSIVLHKNNYPYQLFSSNPLKDCWRRRKFYNHIPAYMVKERISSEIWSNYYKFCFERNPWDKTLSHYYFLNAKDNLTFDEYISMNYFSWNYPLYTSPLKPNEIIVDRVGKYENLTEELSNIFSLLGIPFNGDLGIKAKGNFRKDKRPYQEAFSHEYSEYCALIEEKFAQEIKLHGYTFQ